MTTPPCDVKGSDLIGKVVFLSRVAPTKEYSSYYDGEYLIYQATDAVLYGVLMSNLGGEAYGLGGGYTEGPKPLVGPKAYQVLAISNPDWAYIFSTFPQIEDECARVLDR